MNKYRFLSMVVICVLLLSTLGACKPVTSGRVLLSDYRGQAFTPVAAIEANGTLHFAWVEPDSVVSRQAVVYARFYPDGTFRLIEWHSPTSGVHYGSPDLVVTDGGIAYLSYTACSYSPTEHCDAVYSGFGKSWNGLPPPPPLSAGVGPRFLQLVQRGNWVYVLGAYEPDPIHPDTSSIAYKRLNGGIAQGLAAEEDGYWATDPGGVIDAAGDLHLAFRSFNATTNRIGYANNVGSTGNMGAPLYYPVDSGFATPSISLAESSDDIFVAYAHGLLMNSLSVWRTHPLPVIDPVTLDLGPATGWRIVGSPAISALGTGNYLVVFSAFSSASPDDAEIWTFAKTGAVLDQITNNTVADSPPQVAKGVLELPVYAWRTSHPDPESPGKLCFGDVNVVTDAVDPVVQNIFMDKGTCNNSGFDLAVNGDEGVGVWPDVRNYKTLPEPWYATDWLEIYLPALRK